MGAKTLSKAVPFLLIFTVIGYSCGINSEELNKTQEAIWDVQLAINLPGGFGAEFDGTFFYVTTGFSNLISKYDVTGNLIEEFSIPGVSGLDDIAYDGVYMYGGTGSTNIFQMDFNTHSLVSTISTPFSVRHIAFDENYDAFWIGSWSSPLALISRTGAVLNIFSMPLPTITGTAYDNVSPGGPYLWFFDSGDTIPGPQLIKQFHINSGNFTGVTHDVLSDVGLGQPDAVAGGLFSSADLVQGTFSLGGILVGSPTILFAYEILNPIPIELTNFTANYYNGNVILKWKTATELNNKGFEVQRKPKFSTVDFKTIAFVSGSGTTTQPHTYEYHDGEVVSDICCYRLKQIDLNGSFNYSEVVEIEINSIREFLLFQNYPNPFNPSTKISWQSPVGSWQSLKVYDILGNEIITLVDEYKPAGTYVVEFNPESSIHYSTSGIYFYQLKAGNFIQFKKMNLIK